MKRITAVCLGLFLGLLSVFPAMAQGADGNIYTIGNIVTLGAYEQDNNRENGAEPIEWIVLDVEGSKALLLSRYGLEAMPFNTYSKKITWCRSSLRQWLNYNFFKKAFTVQERERIPAVTVQNPGTEAYVYSYGCDDTQDTIFLLSYAETLAYLPHPEDRAARATDYAVANGAYRDEETGNSWWWLRSPGVDNTNACGVRTDGRISGYGGREVNRKSGAVRPAVWVTIGE